MIMSFSEPNKHGVYSKDDSEEFIFENKHIIVMANVLQINKDTWIHAVSHSLKTVPDRGCTAGTHTPLKASCNKSRSTIRSESIDKIRKDINLIIESGRKNISGSTWRKSWDLVDAWCFNIDRQLNLF